MMAVRQRAWWLLAAIAVMLMMFGITDLAGGATADPGISLAVVGLEPAAIATSQPDGYRMFDFMARSQGFVLAAFALLLLAVVALPYRAGQRWAWLALWLLPVWAVSVPALYLAYGTAAGQPPAPPMLSGPIVALIVAGALLADRGRVIPRSVPEARAEAASV